MLHKDSLNRALKRAIRQTQIRSSERFRCKEPIAEELIIQLNKLVQPFCESKATFRLINFASDLKKWIDEHAMTLNQFFGSSVLSPQPNRINKQQPHLIEAIFATLVRYELLITYLPFIKTSGIGCVLGGSLSYGKFFNVRQSLTGLSSETPPSDIDLLLVCDFDRFTELVDLFPMGAGHSKEAANLLFGMKPLVMVVTNLIQTEKLDSTNVVLSKKFIISKEFEVGKIFDPEKNIHSFPLSIHIMSQRLFSEITSPVEFSKFTFTPKLTDIRLDSPLAKVMVYSTMEGTAVPEAIASDVVREEKEIDFGSTKSQLIIAKLPQYLYWEDRFVAGSFQNLLLPVFEILCDTPDKILETGCKNFREFLLHEGLRELEEYMDSKIAISKLHPRYLNFLQSISSELDHSLERRITIIQSNIISSYETHGRIAIRKKFHEQYAGPFDLYNEILEEVLKNKYAAVLELGCGSGDFLRLLYERGHLGPRVGIDIVPNWYDQEKAVADFLQGDITGLSSILASHNYKPSNFDVIISIHVLYHIEHVSRVLEDSTSWLKDDGKFIASTNSNQTLFFIHSVLRRALINNKIGYLSDKTYNHFSAENASESFREYFKFVRKTTFEMDIQIDDIEDVLEYMESNYDNYEIPRETTIRKSVSSSMREYLIDFSKHNKIVDRKTAALIVGNYPIKY